MKRFRLTLITIGCLLLTSCTSSRIEQLPSYNQNTRIKVLVMHYTALDYQDSVTALVDEGGLSSHYLIPESHDDSYPHTNLKIFQLVDEKARAWHAGNSFWQGMSGLNDQSIGIEIVNVPECEQTQQPAMPRADYANSRICLFPDYDPLQIEKVIELSQGILERNPDIHPTGVVGHADIAPSRKSDPGPRFPWYQLYKAGIGAWYDNQTLTEYWHIFSESPPSIALTQAALSAYGYQIIETGLLDPQTLDVIAAFQMHFAPCQLCGEVDSHTNAAIFALVAKYFPEKLESLWHRYQVERQLVTSDISIARSGQIDRIFPEETPSTRQYVNNRTQFKAYTGHGEIIITNPSDKPVMADIYINGNRLNLNDPFAAQQQYQFSLARRTKNHTNLLSVQNITPDDGQLRIQIPYPTLTDTAHESASNQAFEEYDFSAVDHLIERDIEDGFPGAVLMVVKNGRIVKRSAYGYAKRYDQAGTTLASPTPMTTTTVFDIASNTKTFATTLAIMTLLDTQQLQLDSRIRQYLPEYRGNGRESRTIRDLLTHASGYAPEVRFFDEQNSLGSQFFSQNRDQTQTLLTTQVPFKHGRGIKTQYSDTNFMLLGVLVERITGMPLDEYVESQIYQPLGLNSIRFNPKLKLPPTTRYAATELNGNTRNGTLEFANVRTHTLEGEVHDEKSFYSMGGVSGHAGLFSTAHDLAVLAQTLLNGGGYGNIQLFSESLVNQFSHPTNGDFSVGLGFRRAGNGKRRWQFGPYASEQAYGHTGWTGTLTVIDPEHDLAVILLTNMRHSPIRELRNDKGNNVIDFAAKQFETGKYGSVVSLIYEAVLSAQ